MTTEAPQPVKAELAGPGPMPPSGPAQQSPAAAASPSGGGGGGSGATAGPGAGAPAPPGSAAASPPQPDGSTATPGPAGGAADAASPPKSPQDEAARAAEDAMLKRGQEIAGVRALLARAFSRPAEEPALPKRHWDFLLEEMRWLAVDMTQERLWKQTAAMAVAIEVARLQGAFGLRPPPKDARRYSDEIKRLRDAAAKEAAVAAGKRPTAAAKAENGGLKLDPADDPIFAELELLDLTPGTPPVNELYLSFKHSEGFGEALTELVLETDMERLIREEIAYREYRHEFEAALVSHHLAVQEENRRAMHLDAGLAAEGGLELMEGGLGGEEEEDAAYLGKKNKRRKQQGYLLDDFKDLDTESMGGVNLAGNKRTASRAQIEETYFRKKRRERYRDVDVDYDVSQEPTGRYTTRRASAALGARTSTRLQDPQQQKKKSTLGRVDSFATQQMLRQRAGGGVTGMVLWSKAEDDLLLAIAHEFSGNWTLVSEVLSLSLSMQGIYRPPAMCKQRFRQITTPESGEWTEELALMNLSQTLTKQQAREMLMASLPVRDEVLMPLMEALVQIGAAAKQRRQAEEKKNDPVRRQRQDPHQSHALVHSAVMQQTGNRTMTPLELGEAVNAAFTQQAKTQQLMQQAAMQAQTAGAAGPAAPGGAGAAAGGAAAAPKLPGQPGGLPPGAPGVPPAAGAPQQPGQPAPGAVTPAAPGTLPMQAPMSGGLPQPLPPGQLPPQMAGGAPGSAQARPLLPPQGMTPQAMAQAAAAAAMAQQQQQAAGTPGAPGSLPMPPQQQQPTPGGAPGLGPGGALTPQQQQLNVARQAAAAAAQQAAKNQVTLQQLNNILATNLLPNGQPLPPEMRKQIEEKRNTYLAKTQQAQQAQLTAQARQQQQVTVAQIALQQQQQAAAAAAAAAAHGATPGAPGAVGPQPGGAGAPAQPGAPPGAGMPTNAAAAALHAAQQAMQQQQQGGGVGQGGPGGVRPPGLPPGLYMQGLQPGASLGLAPGAAGQPMALPPGVIPSVSHQMSLAASQGGVPSLQPAMALQSAQLAAAHLGAAGGTPGAPALPPGMQATMAQLTPQQQQQQQAMAAQLALMQQQQQLQQQHQAAAAAAAAQQAAANQAAAAAAQQQGQAAAAQQHVQGS